MEWKQLYHIFAIRPETSEENHELNCMQLGEAWPGKFGIGKLSNFIFFCMSGMSLSSFVIQFESKPQNCKGN